MHVLPQLKINTVPERDGMDPRSTKGHFQGLLPRYGNEASETLVSVNLLMVSNEQMWVIQTFKRRLLENCCVLNPRASSSVSSEDK